MYNNRSIQVKFNQVLYVLFCLYAFSISFELILEELFYLRTIFKPFRVISLAIIGVYLIRSVRMGIQLHPGDKEDIFLYLIFIYGVIASCVQVVTGIFNFALFYNDLFLTGLLALTYFVYKTIDISKSQALRILYFFFLGVVMNAGYIIYLSFFRLDVGRQSGFIDNPNYAALGLVAAMAFLLIKSNLGKQFWRRSLNAGLLVFLAYIFILTGSRTGLIIFFLVLVFLFIFSSFRKKLLLLFIGGILVFQLLTVDAQRVLLFGNNLVLISRVNKKLKEDTEDVRFIIWRGLFRALEDRGYLGMGIGQFKANFPEYYGEESNKLILEIVNRGYYLSLHSDYLAILADYGLPGLLFYLIFLYIAFKKLALRVLYHKGEDEESQFLFRYTFTILACLIIFGLSAENFQHPLYWFLLMFSTKNY